MATKARSRGGTDAAQETIDRIRELNERIIEGSRKAGVAYLDAYERALNLIVEYQTSLADATPIDWLQRTLDAQATFTREVGNLYASTARETLKKS